MAEFKYKARDKFSHSVTGTIFAATTQEAAKKLQNMEYVPISIEEAKQPEAKQASFSIFNRVGLEEVNTFTRQLYSLQKAGLSLLSNLEAIGQQEKNPRFRRAIDEIARDVRSGSSLSQSLSKHGDIFNSIYVNMVKAAEAGGDMVGILDKLSALLEQEIDTNSRITSATRYPILAFFVLCVGFLVVVTFVIPRFAVIYSQFNAALPLPTRILIAVSVALRKYWYLFILAGGAASFAFIKFINTTGGRLLWDRLKLKVPVMGRLVTMLVMSRFARVTAILMKSGVPILEVLDLVAKTSGNVIIAGAVMNIKQSVIQGHGLSEPMKVSSLFPPVVVQMVAAGEQSGKVDELLLGVADYYDRESGYMIKNLSTYIEPVLIFVLGIMVMIMALAIFLPMWNLIKLFKTS